VVGILSLEATAGVKVLGPLPQGLPSFALPMISFAHLDDVIIGGCAVAMVAFADTSVLSRTYAAKTRTSVYPNQEMIGLGAANLAAGLFRGFPISSSSSRTPVAEAAGAKTQFTGVVGAIAVALLLMFAPNLLKDLPSSALPPPSACSNSQTCVASSAFSNGNSGCRLSVLSELPCSA